MDITFVTDKPLPNELKTRLEQAFGFEITLDFEEKGNFDYYFGYPQDGVAEGEEDPLPYEEAVRCCGVLKREGIEHFAIEGNGEWAMGMIERTDFSGFAMTPAEKRERKRISDIFWSEADKQGSPLPKKALPRTRARRESKQETIQ